MSKFYITESDLVNTIRTLVETRSMEEEDLIDIFLEKFKSWVKEKEGGEYSKRPVSYLFDKHRDEFVSDLSLDQSQLYTWGSSTRQMASIAKELIGKGLITPYSLRPNYKFSDKFAKHFKILVDSLNLPPYATLKIIESDNFELAFIVTMPWIERLKDLVSPVINSNTIANKFEDFITKYLGMQLGNPEHGNLQFDSSNSRIVMLGQEEWIDNDLKKIKKDLKTLSTAKNIARIQIEKKRYDSALEFKIILKSRGWSDRGRTLNEIKEYLKSKGYNLSYLKPTF